MKTVILALVGFALLALAPLGHASPQQDFEAAICKAIYNKFVVPRDFIIAGEVGSTNLEFKYSNGKTSDIKLLQSGGSSILDKAYIKAVSAAQMPPRPSRLVPKPILIKATLNMLFVHDVTEACSMSRVVLLISDSPKAAQAE